MIEPFRFNSRHNLVMLLGMKADNAYDLLEGIRKVPLSSIYYHTHKFLEKHRYLAVGPPNDFAYWASSFLNLTDLGELLAGVDVVSFKNLEDLRKEFAGILDGYLSVRKPRVVCLECNEFHFMSSKSFILPTSFEAGNLSEFLDIIGKISLNSIYFHMFEARLRLKRDENDFSLWLKAMGEVDLAGRISRLDPYSMTLERLRETIIALGERYGKRY